MPHCLHPMSDGGDDITPISSLLPQIPSSSHPHMPLGLGDLPRDMGSPVSSPVGLSPAHISAPLILHPTDKCSDREQGGCSPFH